MSKIIYITDSMKKDLVREFATALKSDDLVDLNGKITFSKVFSDNKKAKVLYTMEAWTKLLLILKNFDKEVAWHGVVHRGEDPSEFIITDILVYPQEVTGSTVNTDQEKYQMWLMDDEKDEIFNQIRMQGHSHVNMGTTPSSVDTNHQMRILEQLKTTTDTFYIFQIWNKKLENWSKIYDMQNNVMYENSDITTDIYDADYKEFIEESKKLVAEKGYQTYPCRYDTESYRSKSYYIGSEDYYGSNMTKKTEISTSEKKDTQKKEDVKDSKTEPEVIKKETFISQAKERYKDFWNKGSKK